MYYSKKYNSSFAFCVTTIICHCVSLKCVGVLRTNQIVSGIFVEFIERMQLMYATSHIYCLLLVIWICSYFSRFFDLIFWSDVRRRYSKDIFIRLMRWIQVMFHASEVFPCGIPSWLETLLRYNDVYWKQKKKTTYDWFFVNFDWISKKRKKIEGRTDLWANFMKHCNKSE